MEESALGLAERNQIHLAILAEVEGALLVAWARAPLKTETTHLSKSMDHWAASLKTDNFYCWRKTIHLLWSMDSMWNRNLLLNTRQRKSKNLLSAWRGSSLTAKSCKSVEASCKSEDRLRPQKLGGPPPGSSTCSDARASVISPAWDSVLSPEASESVSPAASDSVSPASVLPPSSCLP